MPNCVNVNIIKNAQNAFFIGVGGVSMSSLARYFMHLGHSVSGSDRSPSAQTRALERDGIKVYIGHDKNNVKGRDLIVYTGAVGEDNPELCDARRLGITTLSRAEFMGALMSEYRVRIGIAGSHGKSTATAMAAHMMLAAKKDPTVMCGADIPELGGAYRAGGGAFVFEACEYRDSFLSFYPNIAVILNVDYDHTDYFKSIDDVVASFEKFAKISSDDGGSIIVCADSDNAMAAVKNEFPITFGIDADADYRAVNISQKRGFFSFDIHKYDEPFIEKITLSVPGRHNIYNALATAALGDVLGIDVGVIASSVSSFLGISRRFEKKTEINGAPVYIDYAHHPREIEATLSTARQLCRGKIITVFEPHTYSRTAALWSDFCTAFGGADIKLFTDIYAARETDTLGVSSKRLAEAANGEYAPSYEAAARRIAETATPSDVVLILGAGTINRLADMLGG